MAVITQKIVIRNLRGKDKAPYRIRLDNVKERDVLEVEIVVDPKTHKSFSYRFMPELLAGKKSVIFRCFGGAVYWLGGLKPELLSETQIQQPNWIDTTVYIGDKKIQTFAPENTEEDEYEFYFRRGNKYYFRNRLRNAVVESKDFPPMKRGDIVRIKH